LSNLFLETSREVASIFF